MATKDSSTTAAVVEPTENVPAVDVITTDEEKQKEEAKPLVLLKTDGTEVQIPKVLSWGKEKQILKIVGQTFETLMPSKSEDSEEKPALINGEMFKSLVEIMLPDTVKENEDLLDGLEVVIAHYNRQNTSSIDTFKLLQFFSKEAPDLISKLVSIITGLAEKDVDDNFDGESVMGFAIPYILYSMRKYSETFAGGMSF